jgi:hypothetical protein
MVHQVLGVDLDRRLDSQRPVATSVPRAPRRDELDVKGSSLFIGVAVSTKLLIKRWPDANKTEFEPCALPTRTVGPEVPRLGEQLVVCRIEDRPDLCVLLVRQRTEPPSRSGRLLASDTVCTP